MELLNIEHELSGPDGALALRKYDDILLALDGRIRTSLAAGLPPDDYAAAEELKDAVVVARKIMRLAQRSQ